MFKKLIAGFGCAALAFGSFANAQEVETKTVESAKATVEKVAVNEVTLDEEGKLLGNVFTDVDGEKTPLTAKVTVTSNGVVVDSVEADEDGVFAFANLAPGVYQMYGSADGYFGGQSVSVAPYSGGGCATCDLGLSSDVSYDSYASAPASCGGGCGGCGGGGLGGRLGGGGGGLLSRRFIKFAAIGGIVTAIATSDSSPDN